MRVTPGFVSVRYSAAYFYEQTDAERNQHKRNDLSNECWLSTLNNSVDSTVVSIITAVAVMKHSQITHAF